jgi:seryl-tRNA synthetase
LTKVTDERAQLQQEYEIALQEKCEVAKKVERVMKEKNEVEERVETTIKVKEEAKKMAQKTQATIQKMYKEIPKVPLVVEVSMEEQVLRISEVIKGFCIKIEDMQSRTMPGTSPE